MDSRQLIERTATAVAEAYREVDLGAAAGLLLDPYYDGALDQLAPLALELREGEVTAEADRDGYQRELGPPEIAHSSQAFELCKALNARFEADEDGYALVEAYWLALASRLHELLGIPVLVPELEMPVAEQLRRQTGVARAQDPLAGLDVAVSIPIDGHRVAAVWRGEGRSLWGSARAPEMPRPIGWNTELGSDPEVRAGWMPPGAVAAILRDRSGMSHEAQVGQGAWLCALPQRAGRQDSPVAYRTIDGHTFPRGIEIDALPALWPRQAETTPDRADHSSGHIHLSAIGWDVFVEALEGWEDTPFRPLAGTVLARPHGFGVERRRREWRAVAACGAWSVTVEGAGEPPGRLDLEALEHT